MDPARRMTHVPRLKIWQIENMDREKYTIQAMHYRLPG